MESKVKKIKDFVVVIAIVFLNCIMTYGAMKINYDNPVYNAYKDGEPDYADGDLEDKLGDSGYYYDLFPEERDGEPDDYQSSKSNNNSKKSTNYDSNFSITDDYIRNMKNINTRKFLEFKDINITKKERPQYKFLVDIEKFNSTPGNVVAYWLSDEYINIFKTSKQLIEIAKPAQGMATGDNKRFVKLWWEVDLNDEFLNSNSAEESKNANKKFVPYNKGGSFRKWYGNNDYILYFKDYGRDIAASSGSVIRNSQLYLQQSITWSKSSSGPIAFRYKPFGHVFDVAGTSIFGDKGDLDYLLGLCNSIVVMGLLKAISPALNYEVGQISTIPVKIDKNNDNYKYINDMVKENIRLSKSDWDSFETSWDFKKHPLV